MGGTLTLLVIKNKGVTFSDYNLLAFWKLNPISDLSSNSETDSGSESDKYNSSLYLDDSESDMD